MVWLGRKFYSAAVMRAMLEIGQNFIMPAIKNKDDNIAGRRQIYI